MAKKIEVFQNEYEFLVEQHRLSGMVVAGLQTELDKLQQDYAALEKEYAELAYRADCYGCAHAVEVDEANLCEQAGFECDHCTAECPCCDCVAGSHYARATEGRAGFPSVRERHESN